jgi:polysaccharide biosynthesis transport protein
LYDTAKFSSIQQQLTDDLIQLEARNIGLNQQLNYLLQVEQQQKVKASQMPQLEQRLRQLERKLGASQATYQLLLQQLQTIELAENQNIGNVRVISYAIVPEQPVSSRSISLLASIVLAGLAAAGVIYVLEITDKSLKTIEEIKKLFGYTWLGVIPALERLNLEQVSESNGDSVIPKLIVRDYPSLAVSESYRMLQSNLKFLSSDRQVKTIVVTSSSSKEGKSTVSANLASAMAQVGHKVLLIDADLHNPIQHHIWNTYNENGLSNVIAEQLDLKIAIQEVMPNLELLTSGVIPPSPATLLDSQRMRILMDYWAERYDFVIIDTPSMDMAADAPIMGRMADGVLLVVKPGAIERAKANFTKEILEQSGQNILGIVFNGVSPNSEPHTYYYHALEDKQETAKLLNASRPQEELWETISRLARESKKNQLSIELNTEDLQIAPLKQLEAMVIHLQDDLAELTKLVTEQEDELLIQRQKVKKLQKKLNLATDRYRQDLESQLHQEQERKRMLDETLVGQRLNLERRKEELYQYQQILEMRQNRSQI